MICNNLKLITLIIGAYLAVCPGFLFADNIVSYFSAIPDWQSNLFQPVGFRYSNLYSVKAEDEPDGYADVFSWRLGVPLAKGKGRYYAGFENYRLRGMIKALSTEDDWLQISLVKQQAYLGGSWELKGSSLSAILHLSDRPGVYLERSSEATPQLTTGAGVSLGGMDIDYYVNNADGNIPFNWFQLKVKAALKGEKQSLRLVYNGTFPTWKEHGFDNRLHIDALSLTACRNLTRKAALLAEAHYKYGYAKLLYNDEIYGRLEHLNNVYSSLWLEQQLSGSASCRLGTRFYYNSCGENSYFDIWPFAYWDVFLAHRTRLKQVDALAGMPFARISYNKIWETASGSFTADLGLEYNHYLHSEDIVIRNRRVIMYPFLFSYDTDYYEIGNKTDGFFFLPISLTWQQWGFAASITLQQLIPIDWKILTESSGPSGPADSDKLQETGGTSIGFYLNYPALN